MAQERWPIEDDVKVVDLSLDLQNYRIPAVQVNETAVLNYLYTAEDVLSLAREILRDGYIDNEVPVVTSESGKLVILEGNRRGAALKGLLDPDSVPSHATQLRTLLKKARSAADDVPERIRVMVAPSRESASALLARLHTTQAKKPWSRDQQATFYFAQHKAGRSVSELAADYPSVSSIPRFMRMAEMRQLISSFHYVDSTLQDFAKSDQLTMSALEYAYSKVELRGPMGIDFDDDGLLISRPSTADQRLALERVIAGFKGGHLSTRSPYLKRNSDPYNDLVSYLAGAGTAPWVKSMTGDGSQAGDDPGVSGDSDVGEGQHGVDRGPEGARSADDAGPSGQAAGPQEGSTAGRRGPNRSATKRHVDASALDLDAIPIGLQERVQELRKADVFDLPAAATMLMRSVLEGSAKRYLAAHGRPASGRLEDVMREVQSAFAADKALKPVIAKIVHNGSTSSPEHAIGTTGWLNGVTHGTDLVVVGDDVHLAWRKIEPLVRALLS